MAGDVLEGGHSSGVINQRLLSCNINANEAPSLALDGTTWRRLVAVSTSSLCTGAPTEQERQVK